MLLTLSRHGRLWPRISLPTSSAAWGNTGLSHMQAVKELLEAKSVDYGFRVYRLPMPTDVPATILSTGTSLLGGSVDVVVPLHATQAPGALTASWTPHAGWGSLRAHAALQDFAPRVQPCHHENMSHCQRLCTWQCSSLESKASRALQHLGAMQGYGSLNLRDALP